MPKWHVCGGRHSQKRSKTKPRKKHHRKRTDKKGPPTPPCSPKTNKKRKPQGKTNTDQALHNIQNDEGAHAPKFDVNPPEMPVPRPERRKETEDIHLSNFILNNAGTQKIKDILLSYNHPAAATINKQKILCSAFHTGKLKREPHKRVTKTFETGKTMCTDICHLLQPPGITGVVYFSTFTDVSTRYTFLISIKTRSDVVESIQDALQYTKKLTGEIPTILYADNAREYISDAARDDTKAAGTIVNKIVPYNPEQNGIAEIFNLALMNGVRAALHTSKFDDSYWPYAIQYVAAKQAVMKH